MPSKLLADFLCSNFTILNFLKTDSVALPLSVKTSATYVLRRYRQNLITCVSHLYCGFNFACKTIVNIHLTTQIDCQKLLFILRNEQETNKQYFSLPFVLWK